ncbi:MAG: amidohydrolase [Woeseiaceae bacterium]|nr:amidohydrolase [Woeseiaceae bacterium]
MKRSLVLTITAALLASCQKPATIDGADLILTNARVYSLNWSDPDTQGMPAPDAPFIDGTWTPDASAIAIRDGLIVALGSDSDLVSFASESTEVIDLNGATLLPGFVESHGHYPELGEIAERIDLDGVTTMDEMAARIAARIETTPAGEWVVGAGWDEGAWADALPTKNAIDAISPEHPVVLKGRRGFGTLVNQNVLNIVGINSDFSGSYGGDIVTHDNSEPTGVFLNRAQTLITDAMPAATLKQKKRIVLAGLNEIAAAGYVSGHHAGVYANYYPAYAALANEGSLPIRVEAMLAARPENIDLMQTWIERGPTRDPAEMFQIRGVKAYYDASLGSRGAKLIEEYADMPGHSGISGSEYGFPEDVVTAAIGAGFQVSVHAIGDAGNREVLDFYERVAADNPNSTALLHRIEHAQIVHPEDFARFGQLNIVASMEPCHAVEDSPWAEDRVGPERIKGGYAWRTLRRNGARLIFNSDLSGTDFNIFYGLHCAVTRSDRTGQPAEGWYINEAVSIEEAVRAWTSWPAEASQRAAITGTLAVGKIADITVLSIDVFNVGQSDPHRLMDGQALMTIVGGKIVVNNL